MTRSQIIKSWFFFLLILLLLGFMSGCSANWHLTRAQKKNPGLFSDTTETVLLTPVDFEIDFNCDSLTTGKPTVISVPVIVKDEDGRTIKGTQGKITLIPSDSGKVKAQIECPPNREITKEIRVPEPYYVVRFWDKMKFRGEGILGTLVILVLVAAIRSLFIGRPP